MRKKMHDKDLVRYIMLALAVVMAAGIAYMGLSGTGPSRTDGRQSVGGVIAKVNGETLDRVTFEKNYENQLTRLVGPSSDGRPDVKQMEERIGLLYAEMYRGSAFDQSINGMLLIQAAKKEGIKTSRWDVNKAIDKIVDGEVAQEKEAALAGYKGKNPDKAFEEALRRAKPGWNIGRLRTEIRKGIDRHTVDNQLMIEKLLTKLQGNVDISDQAIRNSFDEVKYSQITVGTAKRSEVQAEQRAKEMVAKLRGGSDFAAMARENSDDPLKAQGGSMGLPMTRTMIQNKEITDAVFNLNPGQISDPIKTAQGFVILKLESKENKTPADFSDPKKQKQYKDMYVYQAKNKVIQEYLENLRRSAKIDIIDPEMKAYSLLKDRSSGDPKATMLKAIEEYQRAIINAGEDSGTKARVYNQLAYMFRMLRDPKLSPNKEDQTKYGVEEKKAITGALDNTEENGLRMRLVEIRVEDKEFDQAADDLSIIQNNAYNDPAMQQQVLDAYEKMKVAGYAKADNLIAEQRKSMDDYRKAHPQPAQTGSEQMPLSLKP